MSKSAYLRANFFPTITDPNGQTIHDVMGFTFFGLRNFLVGKYVGQRPVSGYTEGAPDAISYLEYGIEDYWWILCLINGIVDPINEINLGDSLIIPNTGDINAYFNVIKQQQQLYSQSNRIKL